MDCAKSARRISEEDHNAKRMKLDNDEIAIKLNCLPDDILYILLSYLDSTAIYNLAKAYSDFSDLSKDDCFWKRIDARRKPITLDMIKHCLKCINKNTKQVLLAGSKRIDNIFSLPESIKIKECQSLRVLALENQTIDGDQVNLNSFPKSLEELSLRRSFILSSIKFFKQTSEQMSRLKVLILDHCKWFTAEHLLPICRYDELEVLSLYMCTNLTDEISYISISCKFGFKKLKILNIRFVGMGDQILMSMYNHPSLQELYFQNYMTTYKDSCKRRKLNISNGAREEDVAYLSDDDASMDVILNKCLPNTNSGARRFEVVTGKGISLYRLSSAKDDIESYVPNFTLYRNQYDECKCGFFDRFYEITENLRQPLSPTTNGVTTCFCTSDTDTFEHYVIDNIPIIVNDGMPFVAEMGTIKGETGDVMKQATPDNQAHLWMYFRKPLNDYEISMYENLPSNILACFRACGEEFKRSQKTVDDKNDAGPSGLNSSRPPNDDDDEGSNHKNLPPPLIGTVYVDSYSLNRRPFDKRRFNRYLCRILARRLPEQQQAQEEEEEQPQNEQQPQQEQEQRPDDQQHQQEPQQQHQEVNAPVLYRRFVINADAPDKFPVNIKRLSFRGYKTVDDDCLKSICHLKLELLDVTGTNVTNVGLYFFMITNPQCRVLHEKGCTCEPRMHF